MPVDGDDTGLVLGKYLDLGSQRAAPSRVLAVVLVRQRRSDGGGEKDRDEEEAAHREELGRLRGIGIRGRVQGSEEWRRMGPSGAAEISTMVRNLQFSPYSLCFLFIIMLRDGVRFVILETSALEFDRWCCTVELSLIAR